jgi:hypothetical protein
VDQLKNSQDFVVGLANSEVGKIAAQAIAAQSGGISSVGGLLNSAKEAGAGGKSGAGAGGGASGGAGGEAAAGGEGAAEAGAGGGITDLVAAAETIPVP